MRITSSRYSGWVSIGSSAIRDTDGLESDALEIRSSARFYPFSEKLAEKIEIQRNPGPCHA